MELLSLNAAGELMDRKSPNVVQGQSSGTGSGGLPPEVEAFRTFAHNTLHCISINQSKFIFQVITEKLQCNNVVALERLPEKHYAH